MSSAPKRQQASPHERTLARISEQQANESSRLLNAVAGDYTRGVRKDQTSSLLGQLSADNAVSQRQVPLNRSNEFQTVGRVNDMSQGRAAGMRAGISAAASDRNEKMTNAARAGRGLAQTSMSNLSSLAQRANAEAQQAQQRAALRRNATTAALGSIAGAAGYQFGPTLGRKLHEWTAKPMTPDFNTETLEGAFDYVQPSNQRWT